MRGVQRIIEGKEAEGSVRRWTTFPKKDAESKKPVHVKK